MILKTGYDFENLGMILRIRYNFENWVWFWKLGMILKIRYDFENLVWFENWIQFKLEKINKKENEFFWKSVMILEN
jgi:hypothetical protein